MISALCFQRFDQLFDIMNSRSPVGKHSKAPMSARNWGDISSFLGEMTTYIPQIKTTEDMNGKPAGTPFINPMRYACV